MTFIVTQSEQHLELSILKDVFLSFDMNLDGILKTSEIKSALSKVFGNVKSNMYKDIMVSLDKNCNGFIDYSEFLVAAADKNKLLN
jgi:calcium-dependent protein kinase